MPSLLYLFCVALAPKVCSVVIPSSPTSSNHSLSGAPTVIALSSQDWHLVIKPIFPPTSKPFAQHDFFGLSASFIHFISLHSPSAHLVDAIRYPHGVSRSAERLWPGISMTLSHSKHTTRRFDWATWNLAVYLTAREMLRSGRCEEMIWDVSFKEGNGEVIHMGYVAYSVPRGRQRRSPLLSTIASASSTAVIENSIILSGPYHSPTPNNIVASTHHLDGPFLSISAIWEPLAFALLYLGLHTPTTPLIRSVMTLTPPPPPRPLTFLAFETHDRQSRPLPPHVLLSKEDLLNVIAMAVSKYSEEADWRASRRGFAIEREKEEDVILLRLILGTWEDAS